jgi:ABC-type antimicrobial peptide transport system permease subunit
MRLMLGIAGAAMVLTVAGLYGTVAFAVSRRRRELGIRLALGAAPHALVRYVMGSAIAPAMAGLMVGLPAAILVGRLMRRLLFGVSPADPWTFLVASAALTVVVALACLAPARRAAGIDPRETLRGD